MVWCSHLFKNFPVCCDSQKYFGIDNKAEVNIFLELYSCFFDDPADVGNLISDSSTFFKIQLENLEVLGLYTVEASLGEF